MSHQSPSSADRPTFVLRLRPEPNVDAVHALRAVLKSLLRQHGMRCLAVSEEHGERP
jgi:hypothetical protein